MAFPTTRRTSGAWIGWRECREDGSVARTHRTVPWVSTRGHEEEWGHLEAKGWKNKKKEDNQGGRVRWSDWGLDRLHACD